MDATGYYYPVETTFGSTDLANDLPAASVLNVWDVGAQGYTAYYKSSRGGWSDEANAVVLGPTSAFWIQAGDGSSSFSWSEERPFDK